MIRTLKRFIAVDGGSELEYVEIACLSTDTKPTSGILNGSRLVEVDTGKKFRFDEDGAAWCEQP